MLHVCDKGIVRFQLYGGSLTSKLTGGNEAQRNCRPVQRLLGNIIHCVEKMIEPSWMKGRAKPSIPSAAQVARQAT